MDYEQPTNYIIKEENYNDTYPVPVLTAGKGFIKGYTNERFGIFDKLPTIIFDDFTTSSQFVNFPFKVKSSAMKILIPKSKLVNLKFVYGAMQVNRVRAETHKRYWISEYSKLKVLLPPLPIQRAIVKKIEQLFSALDTGIADLKKAQEQLKVYRQAVLKKAFEGEPKKQKLGDVSEAIGGFAFKSSDFEDKGKYQVLRIGNIRPNYIRLNSNPVFVNTVDSKIAKYLLRVNDVVISLTGTRNKRDYGFTAVVKNENLLLNQRIAALRFNLNYCPSYFLYYSFTDYFKDDFFFAETGNTGQGNVGMNAIKGTFIPCPPFFEQLQIVKEIESRLSVCDMLEQQINTSLQQSEALRQSILKKAFAGELLTEAELTACKKEPDYEPASVLLERIKREKEKGKTQISTKTVKQKAKPATATVPKVSADIHAGLIGKIIKLHEGTPGYKDKLSHVKCEKIAHLVEYHVRVPLGRHPVKDAAGPDDYPHLKKVESRAIKAGFFKPQKTPIGYSYIPGNNIDKVINKFESSISDDEKVGIDTLLQLFLNFDLEQAEIAATTYAGWNNLIILGNTNPSDEEIVTESRENWSERKLGIPRERFFKAIKWMRKKEINLIPTGYGLLVSAPAKKKK